MESLEFRALLHGGVHADDETVLVSDGHGHPVAEEPQDDGSASTQSLEVKPVESLRAAVQVTDTVIKTDHDVVPRFAAQPTIFTIRSGSWNNPAIWSLGRVPQAGDRVSIVSGAVVTYSQVSDAAIDALEISGTLTFSSTANTRLKVGNLTVLPSGTLEIGTLANPIGAQFRAEFIIADKPLDTGTIGQPGSDPRQYGTGMFVYGGLTIYGAAKNETWLRLGAEPKAGDTSLILSAAVPDWRPGETIFLPDSREVKSLDDRRFMLGLVEPEWEEVKIDRVVGNQVFLTEPLKFNHPGARNAAGNLELLPHAAVLDRNVVVRSENPEGTRGHMMLFARAAVNINYAHFKDLGRTDAFQPLDNTKFDASGKLTHIGTNQVGRYGIHFHRLMGPENPTNTGYQYRFVGNTVEGSRRWAVAVHDSHYGLLEDNIVYKAQGAGIVTEDGSEFGNEFIHNFTARMQGTFADGQEGTENGDYGRGGVGFWFRRSGNIVRDNVATDSTYAGYVFSSYNYTDEATLPAFRGADKHEPEQRIAAKNNPAGVFDGNESYGLSSRGIWAAFITGKNLPSSPTVTFKNTRLWHTGRIAAVEIYHTSNTVFDNLLILGDPLAQNRPDYGPTGLDLSTYENRSMVITNSRIENMRYGIVTPDADSSDLFADQPTVIKDSKLVNYFNIYVRPISDGIAAYGNSLEIRNVRFGFITQLPRHTDLSSGPPLNIYMNFPAERMNYTRRSTVRVYDYNGVPGDNFQVFYREQDPYFVMPQTSTELLAGPKSGTIGSPEAGLTNLQNWNKYGIATAGALLPPEANELRSEIRGFTAPLQPAAAVLPHVAFVTPWDGAQVPGNQPVRIRFNVPGLLPPNSKVYFDLDNGAKRYSAVTDLSIFDLAEGPHVLRAYIGDAVTGQRLPNTGETTVAFAVSLSGAVYPTSNPDILKVTNGNESGPGSLRQALLDANASGSIRTIAFDVDPGNFLRIRPANPLPVVTTPLLIDVPKNAAVEVGGQFTFSLGAGASLTKLGAGTLSLTGAQLHAPGAVLNADAGTLNLNSDGGRNLTLHVNATVNFGSSQHLAALHVAAGASATLTGGGTSVLVTPDLMLRPGATLDLSDNTLIVQPAAAERDSTLQHIAANLTSGSRELRWDGTGINSSAAAADLAKVTAIGMMVNDDGLGQPFYGTFAGEVVDVNSILVRYTYYGDADLNQRIDGTDYALIDNGFNATLSGWLNGDSNFNGVIDGTDYALLDNAFNGIFTGTVQNNGGVTGILPSALFPAEPPATHTAPGGGTTASDMAAMSVAPEPLAPTEEELSGQALFEQLGFAPQSGASTAQDPFWFDEAEFSDELATLLGSSLDGLPRRRSAG